jgi:hypothetical protein
MTKARDLANSAAAFAAVSATELGYVDGVTSAIQTQMDAKIAKTLTTTTGDTIYASAANTPARLGIGSTGQVLTVAAGIPGWATPSSGSMTSLASGSLSSTAVTISSISGSYLDLQLVIRNFKTGTDGATLKLRINGDTNTRYRRFLAYGNSGALAFDATDIQFVAGQSNVNSNGLTVMEIPDYTNTTSWKTCNWVSANDQDGVGGGVQNIIGYGVYNQLAAITSLTLTASAGTMTGTYTLYGVK